MKPLLLPLPVDVDTLMPVSLVGSEDNLRQRCGLAAADKGEVNRFRAPADRMAADLIRGWTEVMKRIQIAGIKLEGILHNLMLTQVLIADIEPLLGAGDQHEARRHGRHR